MLNRTWVVIFIAVLKSLIFFFSFLAFSQPPELNNGESTKKLPQGVVYGVVRRSDPNQQKEMVVYGWSTNQLKEEMNYIKDVRATLEKVRKRMYGDYDEMRQKIRQLTQDLSVSSHLSTTVLQDFL